MIQVTGQVTGQVKKRKRNNENIAFYKFCQALSSRGNSQSFLKADSLIVNISACRLVFTFLALINLCLCLFCCSI